MKQKIALVTGANRGIGYEVCRQLAEAGHFVIMGSRSISKGLEAAEHLRSLHLDVEALELDVSNTRHIKNAYTYIKTKYGHLDILVNNAGVFLEGGDPTHPELGSALRANPKTMAKIFDINTLGPFKLCQTFIPLMKEKNSGTIVNVSSEMGALNEIGAFWPGYRISKLALNGLTKILAAELLGTDIKINSVSPGWVKTSMGGPNAPRDLTLGAKSIVKLALIDKSGPTGGFFLDGEAIPF